MIPKVRIPMIRKSILAFLTALVLAGCSLQRTEKEVAINVILRSPLADTVRLYVSGNQDILGNWKPDSIPLEKTSDLEWSKTFRVPIDLRMEFKITQGTWESEARYQDSVIPPNCIVSGTNDTSILLRPVTWHGQRRKPEGGITGTVEYIRNLKGAGLKYARDLVVWLPPSYSKQIKRRYPVLYMHDGQNIFDPNTSFSGFDWHVDEVADSLIRLGKMQEILIVGIYNTPDRMQEYQDSEMGMAYGEFVVHRVKPYIDSVYRTKPDAKNTAVMGSSLGGLISFLFAWWHPDVFSQASSVSGVLNRSRTDLQNLMEQYDGPRKALRLYMDCGGSGGDERLKPGIDEMAGLLVLKGYVEGKDFMVYYDSTAEHTERSWAARVWRPLLFMFPAQHH
ncbi:MAG TPA: alpha/beta hydrolase-fold protein [Bacteroidota bacterium]|nr:alpha/beta hydrolase-fold protein [Bacteroidota bacterium]